jgi:hypothetical protein
MTKDESLKMAIEWMAKTSTFIPHKGIEGEDLDAEGLQVFNTCKEALKQPEPFISFSQKEWMNQLAQSFSAGYEEGKKS